MIALDTNILVYAADVKERRVQAQSLVRNAAVAGGIIPAQVLAEFTNVCRRKLDLDAAAIARLLAQFRAAFPSPSTTADDVIAAAHCAHRYQLAYFDALICTVARNAGATTLLSEDMQDGGSINGVRILNPFNVANAATLNALFAT